VSAAWPRPPLAPFDLATELAGVDAADAGDAPRETLRGIIRAWHEVVTTRELRPGALAALQRGLADAWQSVHATAARHLAHAAHYFPAASSVLLAATEDPSPLTRLHVQTAAAERPPRPLAVALCTAGLEDRGRQVRERATAVAVDLALTEVVPALRARLAVETDATVQRDLQRALTLLGD
jgi:hypothetical protein